MTLPVELLQRRPAAERYDVAVVGAGIGGLVCAGILARAGIRVVLVDVAKRPGGQVQTIAHQGFAIDLGFPLWEAAGLREALAAAGVREGEPALVELGLRDDLRVAVVAGGAVRDHPVPMPIPGAVPSPSVLDAIRALYGIPPRAFAALGALHDELRRASAEQLEGWRDATLAAWLAERNVEPVVAGALRRSLTLLGAADPDAAPVAALASRARGLAAEARVSWLAPADNPVAGARAIVQALVDALIESGGDLRLGTRVVGLDVDRSRVRALAVQREEHPFLDELVADRVVLALPRSALAELLPRSFASGERSAAAGAFLGMAFAFRTAPSGADDERPARLVRLVAPVGSEAAGPGVPRAPVDLAWPSAWAPRIAPPGEGLLLAHTALAPDAAADLGEVTRVALLVRSAVRDLYPGATEQIAWERQWVRRGADAFALPDLASAIAGLENLSLAGAAVATSGATATGATAAALSGRAAAERILGRA